MHRTSRVPRPLAWVLAIALFSAAGALPVAAQQELLPPPAAGPAVDSLSRTEVLGINQTRRISMASKAPITDLQNENPTVVRIDKVEKDPTSVFVTGVARGMARLILTDVNKRVETIMVRTDDSEQRRLDLLDLIRQVAPTAVVNVAIAPNNTVILTGNVTDIDTTQRVMEAARAVFTIRDGNIYIPANIFNGMRIGGVQQVQLEVVVAVANRSLLREMSFSFTTSGNHYAFNSLLPGGNFTSALTSAAAGAVGNLAGTPNFSGAILSQNHSFQGFLGALSTEGLAKILADTRLTTLSGRPANLVSGGEVPILTSSGVGAPSVSYKQFGTVISFLPVVQNGKIHLEVRAELSSLNAANSISIPGASTPTSVPGFSARSAQTAVQLEDGQTFAIGGLIQNTINATIQRVPVLGNLPFIGVAFTNKSYNEVEEELLILVTPRLVDGIACSQIPKYLPGRETRSPDDFELFLEGILEAPRGPRLVAAHPRQYKGAHVLSANAGEVPCAPPGGAFGAGAGCASGQCGTAVFTPTAIGAPVTMPAPIAPAPIAPAPVAPPLAVPAPAAANRGLSIAPVPAPQAIPAGGVPPVRDLTMPGMVVPATMPAPIPLPPVINIPAVGEMK